MEAAEQRIAELTLEKNRREAAFKAEEAKLEEGDKTAAINKHRAELDAIDAAIRSEQARQMNLVESKTEGVQSELTQKQAKREFAMADRREAAEKKIISLREEVDVQMKQRETGWQQRSMAWIVKAQGKIDAKKNADAEQQALEDKKKNRRKRL